MAFDILYVVNRMLIAIGEKTLSSLSKSAKSQRLANDIIDSIIAEVFAMRIDFRFATARAELAPHGSTPISEYAYMYKLPDGCVRILATIDEAGKEIQYEYRREVYVSGSTQDDVILCNQDSCFIKYIVLRMNPARWPAWFTKLVILKGAIELCPPVAQNDYRKLSLYRELYGIRGVSPGAINEAKAANNAEDANVDEKGRNLTLGNRDVIEAVTGPVPKLED